MPTRIDLARLQSELDDPFTPLLLALADWHEENDQPALARAYRRIASEGKVPDNGRAGWYWLVDSRDLAAPYFISGERFDAVRRHLEAMGVPDYDKATISQAYHALALAYAELEKESTSG